VVKKHIVASGIFIPVQVESILAEALPGLRKEGYHVAVDCEELRRSNSVSYLDAAGAAWGHRTHREYSPLKTLSIKPYSH